MFTLIFETIGSVNGCVKRIMKLYDVVRDMNM